MTRESLPVAVASGPAAEATSSEALVAVSPVRVGIGAGVLAMLYLLVIYLVHPVPARMASVFGASSEGIGHDGGLRMLWSPPPGYDTAKLEAHFAGRGNMHRDHDAYTIDVAGVRAEDIDQAAQLIASGSQLEFHVVVIAPEMEKLASLLHLPMRDAKPVDVEVDQWRADEGGARHTDYYLKGETREQLVDKLAEAAKLGWQLPAGTHIAYEHYEPYRETPGGWRTYVVADEASLDGESIASAYGTFDPNINRPIVLIEFDREGAERFGALTARITGEKLAMVVGEDVRSAPIIEGTIRGGRASITMGGSDPVKQLHERDLLVSTLRAGSLPKGGTVVDARYVAPVDDRAKMWLARVTLAVSGGGLIGLLAWALVRITRPVRKPRPVRATGAFPIGRIGITLLAPLAIYALARLPLLGLDSDAVRDNLGRNADLYLNLGMLGVMPIVTSYLLIEILAMILPGWRRRRHRGPDARRPLDHATIGLALALTLMQGWFISVFLESRDMIAFGTMPRILVLGSLAAGTLVLGVVARVIREHGVGNGYGALVVGGWFLAWVTNWLHEPSWSPVYAGGIVTAVAMGVPVAVVLRWRTYRAGETAVRMPSSGIAPLNDVGGLALVVTFLATLSLDGPTLRLADLADQIRAHHWMVMALVVVLGLVWSAVFARPRVTATFAQRLGLAPPAWSTWSRATLISVALLVLLGTIVFVTGSLIDQPRDSHGARTALRSAMWLAEPVAVAIAAAWLLDVLDDLRARRVALDRVWTVHQAQYADLAVHALAERGIPCHLASSHLRTLYAWFAPFVPIDVLVAPEHVPQARERLTALFAE